MIYKPGHNIYAIYYFSVKVWFAKWNGTFFRSRIIQHLGRIRSDISYISVFSLNAGNCGPEKLRIRTLLTELPRSLVSWIPENFDCVFIALQLASIRFCFFGFCYNFLFDVHVWSIKISKIFWPKQGKSLEKLQLSHCVLFIVMIDVMTLRKKYNFLYMF